MLAMIGKAIDGSQPDTLVIGVTLFLVPALMFMVWGIIDGRGVMFAVHAFFLAFWVFVIIKNLDDFRDSFHSVLSDTRYLMSFFVVLIVSFFIWFFVIRFFFRRRY